MLVIGSKDGTAYITDLTKQGAILQKLNFKPAPNQKNMIMRSCLFARDNSLYTLCTQAQVPTYVIRWQSNQNEKTKVYSWTPAITKEVHNKPSAAMRASRQGQIAVLTSDGYVSLLDAASLSETTSKRRPHVMPITSAVFLEDEQKIITAGLDYKYCILPMSASTWLGMVTKLLINMGFFLLLLLYFAGWF